MNTTTVSTVSTDAATTSLQLSPSQPTCAVCASTVKLLTCARCLGQHYCGKECQRFHWPVHKQLCRPAAVDLRGAVGTADEASDDGIIMDGVLSSKLRTATSLARQREGRVTTKGCGFRPRSEWVEFAPPATAKTSYNVRREVPLSAARDQARLVPRNNERGMHCFGQGKRHQNPPMRAQPKQGGGRQAKWSNPNPKASSGTAAATKHRKNYKQVLWPLVAIVSH